MKTSDKYLLEIRDIIIRQKYWATCLSSIMQAIEIYGDARVREARDLDDR